MLLLLGLLGGGAVLYQHEKKKRELAALGAAAPVVPVQQEPSYQPVNPGPAEFSAKQMKNERLDFPPPNKVTTETKQTDLTERMPIPEAKTATEEVAFWGTPVARAEQRAPRVAPAVRR